MKSIQELAHALGLDADDIRDLLQSFLEMTRQDIVEMRKACADGDYAGLKAKGHSIKGAALNLSAEEIGALALQIERIAPEEDAAAIAEAVERLAALLDQFEGFLREGEQ